MGEGKLDRIYILKLKMEQSIDEIIKHGKFSNAKDYFEFAKIYLSHAKSSEDDFIREFNLKNLINNLCESFGLIFPYMPEELKEKIGEKFFNLESDLRLINSSLADKFYEEWTNSPEKYNPPF
jgi:hypothetical protein